MNGRSKATAPTFEGGSLTLKYIRKPKKRYESLFIKFQETQIVLFY